MQSDRIADIAVVALIAIVALSLVAPWIVGVYVLLGALLSALQLR